MAGGRQVFGRDKALKPGAKILDSAMLLPHGRALSFAPEIVAFLATLFDDQVLAFQTLHFEVGSTQAIHQDTAYVVVDREPMKLAASWIALEDVRLGTGELVFYPRGHRIAEHLYQDGTSKHWNVNRDGHPQHDAHLLYLRQEAARRGLPEAHFLPKKGDALIWHADLPHGGGTISQAGVTRRSLVTHYCPMSQEPYYLQFIPAERRRKVGVGDRNAWCSMYFPPERILTS
jgi:ectoine hydroxylase-related dioxygenase (phytanoyl-CoA dioxygenase family)